MIHIGVGGYLVDFQLIFFYSALNCRFWFLYCNFAQKENGGLTVVGMPQFEKKMFEFNTLKCAFTNKATYFLAPTSFLVISLAALLQYEFDKVQIRSVEA